LTKAGDLRVGYTFAFGGKGKKAKTQKKVAATPVSNDASAWMPKPFNAKKGYAKLINELVPSRMRENKLDVLNAEAKPFFAKLKETGVTGDEYHEYAAGYFTALAVEYNKNSDVVHAMSCLDKALKFSPNFKEAVDLKAKLNVSAGAWIPKPFDAHKAYTILLKELCPKRMQENKLDVLNVEAKPFFAQLTKNGFTEQQYHEYAAGYFVTLAVEFYQSGDMSRTQACLARALKLSPGYKPAMVLKAKLGETGDWMPKPFIAQKAFIKLKTVLVPARLGENKLGLLNAEAKPFFAKLSEVGIQGKAYNDYALGFFTALAVEFNKRGDKARAKEFLNKVLGLAPDFKEALDLRDRMEGKVVAAPVKAVASTSSTTAHGTVDAGWWPKPFAASTAYAKLKNELVPARVKVNKLSDLAKEAKPFFAKLKENGVGEAALNNYKAGYYAAIADNLLVQNDLVRADYYVDNALKIAPNNKYVLEVKGKIEAVK
jgi:tetratricopeptide (TPR) repeat protein